jgi:hypothetical protein
MTSKMTPTMAYPARVVLFLLATFAAGCATSPSPGPSALSPEDRELVDKLQEAIGVQGRQLYAAQAEAAPDCARVCLLVGNICSLAEKICGIATRYPATDPVAADCLDARGRCQRARETAATCACRQ